MHRRLVLVALALALMALVALWAWWPADPAVTDAPGSERNAAGAQAAAAALPTSEAATVRTEPGAAEPARAPAGTGGEPTADLLVRVSWSDGERAAGVRVYLALTVPGASRPLAERLADEHGEVRARVPAGKVRVTSDRGGRAETDVEPGRTNEVELKLEAGLAVTGSVHDAAGRPVAGAETWLTSSQSAWCAGVCVAQADAAGEFRLRDVPKTQSLGAVAPGYAPSKLVDLELVKPQATAGAGEPAAVRIELVLDAPGGSLTGLVADEQGNGVADAIVAVGRTERLVNSRTGGTREERWPPRRATTGEDGAFGLAGLLPGTHPVEVWSDRFALWRGECTIAADAGTRLDVTLLRGVTIAGTVTGEDGKPLAGACVRCYPVAIRKLFLAGGQYDFESAFGAPFAVADAEGRYMLRGAAPPELHLYAGPGGYRRSGDSYCWANDVLAAQPGDRVEWNPRIDPGLVIRGVVRYRDGVPMPGVFVTLVEPGVGERMATTNDRRGRFRFVRLQRKAYDLLVQVWDPPQGAPPVEAREVWPGPGDVVIEAAYDAPKALAPASVTGRVVDTAGRVRGKLSVLLTTDRSWRTDAELEDGVFRFDNVEPGRRRVVVMSDEDPVHYGPWFDLEPAEQKDLGTIVTAPGGRLRLSIVRHPGAEEQEPTVYLWPPGAAHARKVVLPEGSTERQIENLCAGEHVLSVSGEGIASIRDRQCTVIAGEQTTATIDLWAAVRREIVVDYAAAQRVTHVLVQDERGTAVLDLRPEGLLERPFRLPLQLALGRHTFRVETEGGVAETTFEMGSLAEGQPPVVLQAK